MSSYTASHGFEASTLPWWKAATELRHTFFVQNLGWVPDTGVGAETDGYDTTAYHIAVHPRGEEQVVAGYVRLHPGTSPWMLEREFGALVPDGIEKHPASFEITRLCVDPSLMLQEKIAVVRELFLAIESIASDQGWHTYYAVVEEGWPRLMSHLIPELSVEVLATTRFNPEHRPASLIVGAIQQNAS